MEARLSPAELARPAGEWATPSPATLRADETVETALQRLRSEPIGERIVYFYVLNQAGGLAGVVATRKLLLARPTDTVGALMTSPVFSVSKDAPLRTALQVIQDRKLLAVPVVDGNQHLLGTIEVALLNKGDELDWRNTDAIFQLVGLHLEAELQRSPWGSFRNRFPWLLLNVTSGLLMAFVSGLFEHALAQVVAITFFVPVVLAVAESVSIQSLTLTLQSLAPGASARVSTVPRTVVVAVLLGLGCAVVVGGVAYLWKGSSALALVLCGGMLASTVSGALVGLVIPRVVHRLRLDPKVSSGPATLALADLLSLTGYFALAALVLL